MGDAKIKKYKIRSFMDLTWKTLPVNLLHHIANTLS